MSNKVNIQFEADISKGTAKVKAFGSSVKNVFSDVSKYVDAATRHFGFFGTAVTAFTSGAVLKKLFSPKDYMLMHDSLLMMGVNLRKNVKELENFKSKLSKIAGEEGEDIEKVFRLASKLSVDYKEEDILKIIKASAKVSDAMGQDLDVSTERVQQLMRTYEKIPEEADAVADALIASRLTNIETLDLLLQKAALSGGTSTNYKETLAFFGGLEKMGFTSRIAITKLQSAISALFENSGKLKMLGINVFKTDASGKKTKKNAVELLQDLDRVLKKFSRTMTQEQISADLDKLFGENAGSGILKLIKRVDVLKKALEDQNNAAQIAAKLSAAANEQWSEQLQKIKGHLADIRNDLSPIYEMGGKPLKLFAESPKLTKGLGYAAAGLSLGALFGLGYGKGKAVWNDVRSEVKGLAKGKAVEAATGVTPVYVTNWPSGGIGSQGGILDQFGRPIPTTAGSWGAKGAAGGRLAQLGYAGLIAGSIYGISSYLSDKGKENWPVQPFDYEKSKALVPHKKIDLAGLSLSPKDNWNFKNNININMTIDEKGKVFSNTDDMNTVITLKRTEH